MTNTHTHTHTHTHTQENIIPFYKSINLSPDSFVSLTLFKKNFSKIKLNKMIYSILNKDELFHLSHK